MSETPELTDPARVLELLAGMRWFLRKAGEHWLLERPAAGKQYHVSPVAVEHLITAGYVTPTGALTVTGSEAAGQRGLD